MANNQGGTNMAVPIGTGIEGFFTNNAGNWILVRSTTSGIPSAQSGYATGCHLQNATTGSLMVNTGSETSCTFKSVSVVFGS